MRVEAEVARLRAETERHAKVNVLLTGLGEKAQAQAQDQLEQLVTRGLQVIFGTELSFHVVQAVKANQSVTDFVIRSTYEGNVTIDTPVMEARGGGMAEVVGFMVRLVVLLLTPGARLIMFLDETFGFLSKEYEPRLAEFLAEVALRAGVQVFLVTHSDAYDDFADARVRLVPGRDGGVTVSG
jgi:predicted ATPase